MSKTKTTPNKIEANRRNAKKSTGPRSAAGKAKSSRNAVKHGLLASRIVLADNPEEDPKQFNLLLDGLREDYQPQSTIETMLVERLAASFWRLRRAYRFEVETITQANQPNPFQDALDELSPLPPVKRGERILPPQHSLDRLIRYETMIDRELLRTLRQLELRQQLRKIEQAPQPQEHEHGQEYLPMPPDHAPAERLRRVAAGASAGRPPIERRRPTLGSAATKALPPHPAKAPAPNEATAMPSAGSATRCERQSSSTHVDGSPFALAPRRKSTCPCHPTATRPDAVCHVLVGRALRSGNTAHKGVAPCIGDSLRLPDTVWGGSAVRYRPPGGPGGSPVAGSPIGRE